MTESPVSTSPVPEPARPKVCRICSAPVSTENGRRDVMGHYYCASCFDKHFRQAGKRTRVAGSPWGIMDTVAVCAAYPVGLLMWYTPLTAMMVRTIPELRGSIVFQVFNSFILPWVFAFWALTMARHEVLRRIMPWSVLLLGLGPVVFGLSYLVMRERMGDWHADWGLALMMVAIYISGHVLLCIACVWLGHLMRPRKHRGRTA